MNAMQLPDNEQFATQHSFSGLHSLALETGVGIFQVAEAPENMYDYTVPFKGSNSKQTELGPGAKTRALKLLFAG